MQALPCGVQDEVASSSVAGAAAMGEFGADPKAHLKSKSSSSSSSLPVEMAATSTSPADSCRSHSESNECDDSASTAASEVDERFADFVDSDEDHDAHDEQHQHQQHSGAAASSSSKAPAAPARADEWADLADEWGWAAPKAKWADLADESDEEGWAGMLPPIEEGALPGSPPKAPAASPPCADTAEPKCSPAAGPGPAKLGVPAQPTPPPSAEQASSSAVPSEGAGAGGRAARSATRETRKTTKAAAKAARNAASQGDDWWPPQQWGARGSQWWEADASWWGSKNQHRDWWSNSYSYGAGARGAVGGSSAKPQCQFFVGIEEESKFRVTRKVLGPHGQYMKAIAEASGAKLRLRGKGSGFLEGPEQQESMDELMLCVSATDSAGYQEAVRLVRELMERVYDEYRAFCQKTGKTPPHLEVRFHEGPRPGSR